MESKLKLNASGRGDVVYGSYLRGYAYGRIGASNFPDFSPDPPSIETKVIEHHLRKIAAFSLGICHGKASGSAEPEKRKQVLELLEHLCEE